jgi:hypothetical protein
MDVLERSTIHEIQIAGNHHAPVALTWKEVAGEDASFGRFTDGARLLDVESERLTNWPARIVA